MPDVVYKVLVIFLFAAIPPFMNWTSKENLIRFYQYQYGEEVYERLSKIPPPMPQRDANRLSIGLLVSIGVTVLVDQENFRAGSITVVATLVFYFIFAFIRGSAAMNAAMKEGVLAKAPSDD